jgi:hypothetical protein
MEDCDAYVVERRAIWQPARPAEGQCFLVANNPLGRWHDKAGHLAIFINGAWSFISPQSGMRAYSKADNSVFAFETAR